MQLLVRHSGFLSTVQDLGRAGYRASGVSLGGALDPHALRVANLLVGNDDGAAGLELTLGNVRLACDDDRLVAWCGGPFDVQVGGLRLSAGRVALLMAGEELVVTAPPEAARAWIAISGGIDVRPVLGSRSTDLRSGFGGLHGRALRDGDALPLGQSSEQARPLMRHLSSARVANWTAPNEWSNPRTSHGFLRLIRGAEWSQFETGELVRSTYVVMAESDRMGVRLQGPELRRETQADLLSEPVAPGTIQVPPSGQPILLLGDCQTIGGYPKIAHVITVDLAAAAQLRPGDWVHFAETTLDVAQRLLIARERDVERFRVGLELRIPWS